MGHIYIEADGKAYKELIDLITKYADNDGGKKGFKSYIMSHHKQSIIDELG